LKPGKHLISSMDETGWFQAMGQPPAFNVYSPARRSWYTSTWL
jgi:hypothetical protein